MKKVLAFLLVFASLFTLVSCNSATTYDPAADETLVRGEWGTYVGFQASKNKLITPHKEMVYMRSYHESENDSGDLHVSSGQLMFSSAADCLPQFADQIPKVRWNKDFSLVYLMDEGITYKGGEKFSVYGEDYTELAKNISRDELLTQSESEWGGKTVYIQFGGVFYHKINDTITEDISNVYFIKTTFPS